MNRRFRNFQKNGKKMLGFTLIEIVLVLTILGAATIITISAFNSSDDTAQAQEEVSNLSSLSGAIRNMFNTQGSYSGLENAVILRSVSFPEQMRVPNNNSLIKHSWANDGIDVAPIAEMGTTDDSFVITLKDVPSKSCASIASLTFRHYMRVTVGSTDITDVGAATTACGTSGSQTMQFVAR